MSKSGLCPCGPGDHGALGDSSCSGTGVSGCWSSFASSVAADAFLRWAARCLNAAMMSCVVHDMPFWRTVARGCSATRESCDVATSHSLPSRERLCNTTSTIFSTPNIRSTLLAVPPPTMSGRCSETLLMLTLHSADNSTTAFSSSSVVLCSNSRSSDARSRTSSVSKRPPIHPAAVIGEPGNAATLALLALSPSPPTTPRSNRAASRRWSTSRTVAQVWPKTPPSSKARCSSALVMSTLCTSRCTWEPSPPGSADLQRFPSALSRGPTSWSTAQVCVKAQ
mmetsp:Transcript_21573/g.51152  ORF Transcript_21573/g.51152 Transcript_21573/m.51152 type:complete len:281 (-) Transcript_21573:408-1250(-)